MAKRGTASSAALTQTQSNETIAQGHRGFTPTTLIRSEFPLPHFWPRVINFVPFDRSDGYYYGIVSRLMKSAFDDVVSTCSQSILRQIARYRSRLNFFRWEIT
ncbi:uncharacterized protein LOC143149719 [Ptiloglossa arizonensis]|uniref:uncharacterized protein LOC143149719 n=1 Tax=Ptiloglossa arizonensis TaxID=3350558 RepID=UPI003F9FA39E